MDKQQQRPQHPVADANEESPFGPLSPAEFYARHNVTHSTSSFVNPQGLRIFTQSWLPATSGTPPPLGIVCVVHGYTGESNWLIQLTSVFFAQAGFAVCALDHQGHGFSDGLVSHIPDIRPLVRDCITSFRSFRSYYPPSMPAFLYSESLGGAIALLIHLANKEDDKDSSTSTWDGAILNGAMCGISDKIKPPWPLEHLLGLAAAVVPTWRVVPTRGTVVGVSFKEEWKRRLAAASPRRPMGRPRAATALELMRVCRELQGRFEEVSLPLLIVHGSEDVLCDPACVEELHRRASSSDKTLRIYPGMWHQLVGEPQENVDLVFREVLDWLLTRAAAKGSGSNDKTNADAAAAVGDSYITPHEGRGT